jgi:hypothetical protein
MEFSLELHCLAKLCSEIYILLALSQAFISLYSCAVLHSSSLLFLSITLLVFILLSLGWWQRKSVVRITTGSNALDTLLGGFPSYLFETFYFSITLYSEPCISGTLVHLPSLLTVCLVTVTCFEVKKGTSLTVMI